jgi:L-lactate dehydrogenase
MKHSKIAIIGTGNVGSTTAYALMLKNIVAEILLIDINKQRCIGEFLDLSDALAFNFTSKIREATLAEIAAADIIIITAGIAQKPGQSRVDLLKTNKKIMDEICKDLTPLNPQAVIIVVTNPVDLLTLHVQQIVNHPRTQIFGSGTYLDSQRLRLMLALKFNVALENVQTYILGEHGDTQFPAWSLTQIGGKPILSLKELSQQDLVNIADEVKQKAYNIISCKGSTFYGIAACVASICESIIFDQERIIPVSMYDEEFGICLSMPCIIGQTGIEKRFSIPLDKNELENLKKSADNLIEIAKK